MQSNVHFRVLLNKVTPELPKFLDITRKELEYGWALDMPQPEGSYRPGRTYRQWCRLILNNRLDQIRHPGSFANVRSAHDS